MILVPTACGLEVAGEKTWNFWVFDDSTSYAVTSKSNADRTFNISFSPGTGNPFVCMTGGYRFMQGINTFDLSTSHSDTNTALIKFSGGWNGCSHIHQGQTVSARISSIPSWLDFNSQFSVGINSDIWLRITMINVDLTASDVQLLVKSSNTGASSAMPTLQDYTYEFGLHGYGGGLDWTRDPNGGVFLWNWGIGGTNQTLAILPAYTGHNFSQDDTYYLLLYNQGTTPNNYRVRGSVIDLKNI